MSRGIFLTLLFLTLPGVLWQAFEMYGLTLGGSQMLFFSIVHTMPLVALLVMAAVPLGLVVLMWATFGLLLPPMRNRLDIERTTLVLIVGYLTVHGVFLAAYDVWSNTIMRVPVCILGIVSIGGCILLVVRRGLRGENRGRSV
jgi:hypothetical protein